MKQQGYNGHIYLGLNKHGMLEPLMPPRLSNNVGLGFAVAKFSIL